MDENLIKKRPTRFFSFLLTIPALIIALISLATAIVGLGLIPIVPAGLSLSITFLAWYFFNKSYKTFTIIIIFISIIAIVVSIFRGLLIDTQVATDSDFDSSIVVAQEGIDEDLSEAFGDEGFGTEMSTDSVVSEAVETIQNQPASSPGQEIYLAKCVICHMSSGQGIELTYPPLAGSDYLKNADKVIENVLFGNKGGITVNGKYYSLPMPNLDLTDEEALNVINFIRSNWGNEFDAISLEQIQAIRLAKSKK
ncbi:MAG: cytochrome c [Bacteroidales bacterium]